MAEPLLHVQRKTGALHIWIGSFGAHLFWPDAWKSRPDYCAKWREPLA